MTEIDDVKIEVFNEMIEKGIDKIVSINGLCMLSVLHYASENVDRAVRLFGKKLDIGTWAAIFELADKKLVSAERKRMTVGSSTIRLLLIEPTKYLTTFFKAPAMRFKLEIIDPLPVHQKVFFVGVSPQLCDFRQFKLQHFDGNHSSWITGEEVVQNIRKR